MKRTLFKHEAIRTWRWLAVLALAASLTVLVFAGGAMLLPAPLSTLLAGLSVVIALALSYAVPLLMSLDFYRSCYSKTGYFTAAIPVRGATIFTVKAVYAYLVSLLGMVLAAALLIPANIATGASSGVSAGETLAALRDALAGIGRLPAWAILLLLAGVLLLPLVSIAPYLFAATVGSQSWINRAGFGGVVLTWFLYYVGTQVITAASLFIPPSVDLRHYPELRLTFDPLALVQAGDNAPVLPIALFVVFFGVAVVGMVWARVSYDRRLELR